MATSVFLVEPLTHIGSDDTVYLSEIALKDTKFGKRDNISGFYTAC